MADFCPHDLEIDYRTGRASCSKCGRTGQLIDGVVQWDQEPAQATGKQPSPESKATEIV